MPSQESIATFQKGLQVLSSAEDYLSLKNTILNLMSVTEVQDDVIAKDAIANVLRKKQASDIQRFKHYPRELEAIDQRYKDLAAVLEASNANLPNTEIKALPNAGLKALSGPLDIISKLSKNAIIDFFLQNKALSVGSAAALAGGSYLVYKKFFDVELKLPNPPADKESNFEKTIRSIQKYRAFSQLSKDPDFDGNYLEVFQGKAPKKKKTPVVRKKSPEDINTQWEREERSLMQNMDVSFNEIAIRPRVEFQMPQLPAPNRIDPNEIIGVAKPLEEEELFKKEKKSRPKKDESKEEKPKRERPAPRQSMDRLVPIVKRTKRIKKVEA